MIQKNLMNLCFQKILKYRCFPRILIDRRFQLNQKSLMFP
jgi:hypothetical protein